MRLAEAFSQNNSFLPLAGVQPAEAGRPVARERGTSSKIRELLSAQAGLTILWDEPLARHTTFRVGGPVAALVEPENETALAALIGRLRESGVPIVLIGGGSNLLAPDAPMDLVAIRLGEGFSTLHEETAEERLLVAGAGVRSSRLLGYCIREGLSGLEFLTGIPGTIGGALIMNAGTSAGCMADGLGWIDCLGPEGRRVRLERSDLHPRYRSMGLPADCIVLAASLRVERSTPQAVKAEATRLMVGRRKSQPHGLPSAGCIFKNPPEAAAGALIERAGLKGFSIGEALVSTRHANWIVNRGKASAADILALIRHIEREVFARFGVQLEREVRILGEDGA